MPQPKQTRKADGTPFNTHVPIEVNGQWYELWAYVIVDNTQTLGQSWQYPLPCTLDQIVSHRQHCVARESSTGKRYYRPDGSNVQNVGGVATIYTAVRVAVDNVDAFDWSAYVLYYA